MAAVWMRFRAELRGRWRALLAVGVLVGLAGGVTLAALAGARRTESAFGRLVAETEAWDLLVNPDLGTETALDDADVKALPQVRDAARVDGLFVGPGEPQSLAEVFEFGIVFSSDGRAGYEFGRPRLVHGRMPRRDRPHEVLVNPLMAEQQGWRVGDRVALVGFTAADVAELDARAAAGEATLEELGTEIRTGGLGEGFTATITGIGVMPDEILVDEGFEVGQMLIGPAFSRRHPDVGVAYWAEIVRLRRGAADLPEFRRAVEALVPDEAIAFQSAAATTTKVERAVRPSVGALTVFAVVIALTGVLVIGQALSRQTFLDAVDNDGLRALGATRAQLFATTMLGAVVVSAVGAAGAVVLAVAVSPLMPIGVARASEPDPGVAFDPTVLTVGFLAIVTVVLLLTAVPAWRTARARAGDRATARPSRAANVVAEMGMSVSASAGVRMALEPGRGRTAVPVRTTIVSAALAIAVVVGAGVFAASLDHLVSSPHLFGWNWDQQMAVNAQTGQAVPGVNARAQVIDILESSNAVARWGTVSLSDVTLDGVPMPAVGMDVTRGGAVPTLVDGALPRRDDEIALGRLTQRELGVRRGDTVRARRIGGGTVPLEVVGTVVLPGLGTYPGSDKTSLGEGAVTTRDTLYALGPDFGRDDFVVEFASAATAAQRAAVIDRAQDVVTQVDPEGFDTEGVQRPSDIVAYDRVRSTPLVLALVLAVLAAATVGHALVTATRRRRRDLAMLATLGFTRRQVSATVGWQATTVGVLALVVGVPLGIIGGRWAWGLLADDLGTISEPRIPTLAVLLAVPTVLLLCNLVAFVPGRIAARIRPAVVLRSE